VSYPRRRFLAASGALALASCGGGGGGNSTFIGGPPAAYRPGISYGYWGDDAQQAAEVADHTNLYLAADWDGIGPAGVATNIARAKAAGLRDFVVLMNAVRGTPEQTLDVVNAHMAALTLAGALDDITLRGLIWCDEPNNDEGIPLSDAFVRAVNIGLRGMTAVPLWVAYADKPGRPGLEAGVDPRGAFDRVAVDQYDIGCGVLGGLVGDLAKAMKPGARRWLIPGPVGGHFSQADPACFENFAYANPDIEAIVAFIWRDRWNSKDLAAPGVRSIPALRTTYTALGKRLTAKP
jgi:hypothetical protein